MFMLCECILFILIVLYNSNSFKYLGIVFCLVYGLYYRKKESWVIILVLIADYCLLLKTYYRLGLLVFILVQCCYHNMLKGKRWFYIGLLGVFLWSIESLAMIYAIMSFLNIKSAFCQKHWLFNCLLLLGICDIGVALQFVLSVDIPWIWWFYLPSQVFFIRNEHEYFIF